MNLQPEKSYPLPGCDVPPSTSVNIITSLPSASKVFRPMGFIIPKDAAEALVVSDVKIGKNSQLVSTGCVPASLFAVPDAQRPWLRFDSMGLGMLLSLSLTNLSTEKVRFSGEVLGHHEESEVEGLWLCGLGHTTVPPEEGFVINVQAQLDLCPRRLFIPNPNIIVESLTSKPYQHGFQSEAGYFAVDGPGVSEVSNSRLSAKGLQECGDIYFEPDRLIPHWATMTFRVRNLSKSPQTFTGAILG